MTTATRQACGSLLSTLLLTFTAGQPFISLMGPSGRTTPGKSVSFNCTAGPASDGNFTVTWMKDGEEHPASAQHLMTDSQGNYSITSKVCIRLLLQDLLSKMTCEVAHPALAEPLRRTFNLSQVLQVVPTLKITTKHLRHKVNLTCHAYHFYPSELKLSWMHWNENTNSTLLTSNPDGTFSMENIIQIESRHEGQEFACWAVQDAQPVMKANITLRAHDFRGKGRMDHSHTVHGPMQRFEPGSSIRLTYTWSGFHERQYTVVWLKNSSSLTRSQTSMQWVGSTYNISSSVLVPLQADDIFSFVLCHVTDKNTQVFQQIIRLDQYLRVPPIVTISQSSPSSDLVAVTCHVQKFYPARVHLSWLKNCQLIKAAQKSMSQQNSDGTYTLEAFWLVNASTHLEQVLTCEVQHEAQLPIWANLILSPAIHDKISESPGSDLPIFVFVTFLLGVKVLLVMSFVAIYTCKCWNL